MSVTTRRQRLTSGCYAAAHRMPDRYAPGNINALQSMHRYGSDPDSDTDSDRD
jgi:hypothetical protein